MSLPPRVELRKKSISSRQLETVLDISQKRQKGILRNLGGQIDTTAIPGGR
jgi:hypothetical protein